jgi:hypothetical protein
MAGRGFRLPFFVFRNIHRPAGRWGGLKLIMGKF